MKNSKKIIDQGIQIALSTLLDIASVGITLSAIQKIGMIRARVRGIYRNFRDDQFKNYAHPLHINQLQSQIHQLQKEIDLLSGVLKKNE
jgi:hypothetical protein